MTVQPVGEGPSMETAVEIENGSTNCTEKRCVDILHWKEIPS